MRLAQHLYPWPAAWFEHWSPIQVLTGVGVAQLQWSDGNWLAPRVWVLRTWPQEWPAGLWQVLPWILLYSGAPPATTGYPGHRCWHGWGTWRWWGLQSCSKASTWCNSVMTILSIHKSYMIFWGCGSFHNLKKLQQKVSMHFLAAQDLQHNISIVYHWGDKGNWSNHDVKEISLKAKMQLFWFWGVGVTILIITWVLLRVY